MANEREGSGIPSWVLGIVAVLGVAGFLFWLSSAAQPAEMVAITEGGDTTAAAPTGMTGEVVTLQQIAAGTDTLQGRDLVLESVEVAAAMGQQAFWVDLPNQQPFLIKMSSAAAMPVQSGDVVDVAGRIQAMSDSVIADWKASGAITENQEAEALFAQSFLEARTVRAAQ
ncbi:MAG TPA: hypothetical protein VFU06_02990 [Longimicrobiales bacterium]|nr:hypothetical protein [Longimicrobiales bacterium]